jgi:NADPH:quinone reductase-like Zn-dependent oxidoreductase
VPRVVVATATGGPEVLAVVDEPTRPPDPGEAVVAIRAAGVNPVDVKRYGGSYGNPQEFPMRLGFELAGVVVAVGDRTEAADGPLAVADEVIGYRVQGAYADELVTPGFSLVHKPSTLDWASAAGLMLAGATAVHALDATEVGEGSTVLVHAAAGAVGLMAVQLARIRGARVVGTASERNHALLRELGAEPVAYGAGLLDRVRAVAPQGFDAVVDAVGSGEALDVSLAVTSSPAHVAELVVTPRARESGVLLLGGAPGADPGTEIRDRARPVLAALAGEGRLHMPVAGTYPLEGAAEAHRAILGAHPVGKIVLVP